MKAREWQSYLEEQLRVHDKRLFTVTELANAAGTSLSAVNVELARLRKYGIIVRYSQGIYGLPGIATPEILLPALDPHAYLTGGYALFRRHLAAQIPSRLLCFTDRRHGQARVRRTEAGTFQFVCAQPPVYHPPASGAVAEAEEALCDFVYISRRSGAAPEALVSFRNRERIRPARLRSALKRYPKTVGIRVGMIMGSSWIIHEPSGS
ncbi:MAG: hypothetical protein NTV79_08360 [Candidatus Aureabacteria bacterium]|nr:hypothetical protein [Candidatus Auribacterota bacterium]